MRNNYKKFLLVGALSLIQYNAVASPGNTLLLNSNRMIMNNTQPQHYHRSENTNKSNTRSIGPSIDIANLIDGLDEKSKKKILDQQKIEDLRNKHLLPQANKQSKLKK